MVEDSGIVVMMVDGTTLFRRSIMILPSATSGSSGMNIEKIRQFCLSLPNVTEDIQWENDLPFRIGGKIFAGVNLKPSAPGFPSFKCTPDVFAELTERPGMAPARYVRRYHWVSLKRADVLEWKELRKFIANSYELVRNKLPVHVRRQLAASQPGSAEKRRRTYRARRQK
jgi:predicted DNA-binding protein (MmcQ/YjbR family)